MNWLDLVFGLILAASAVSGFRKGLLRIGIGLGATILGFLVASWSYGTVGFSLRPYVPNKAAANFLAFLLIFCIILGLGALVAAVMARIFKLVGLTIVDRILGAVFGVVRGMLICVVIAMIMLAFAPGSTRAAVGQSYVGPYVVDASRVLSAMTPHEIRDGFHDGYDVVRDMWTEAFKKKPQKKAKGSDDKDTL
jgi:membrane protein required for colicin V production